METRLSFSTFVKCFFFTLVVMNFRSVLASEKLNKITPSDSVLPMFFGLLVILSVIFLLAFLFKRFSNFSSTSGKIKILESQIIGSKEKLLVVEVGEQQFFLGVTNQNITSLGELDEKNKLGQETDKQQPGFSNLFTQMLSGKVIHLNQASTQSKSDSNVN